MPSDSAKRQGNDMITLFHFLPERPLFAISAAGIFLNRKT